VLPPFVVYMITYAIYACGTHTKCTDNATSMHTHAHTTSNSVN